MKLTDKEMKSLIDGMAIAGFKHDSNCPWKNSLCPVDVCRCNCYEFALMQAAADYVVIKIAKGKQK